MCLLDKVLEVIGLDSLDACSALQDEMLKECDFEGIAVIEQVKRRIIPNFEALVAFYQQGADGTGTTPIEFITTVQGIANLDGNMEVLEELCVLKNFFIEDGFYQE